KWYTDSNYSNPVPGTVPENGNITVTPSQTTTYYLRAESTADPCNLIAEGPTDGITVTVNEPVEIIADLDDSATVEVCAGFPVEFSIEATGNGLTYEWTRDGDPVGGNSPTLNIGQA